ncbi:MAG: adenosylcobinamide-GDP ribazoletransferase [Cardiobacteriaceae bacterium]|nr:adenosylcobinamide-GDP ribazoletransferase [Cardiobacteriaceae bacterium]
MIFLLLSPWRAEWVSVIMGGSLCLLTTVVAFSVFRKLPQILSAKDFFRAMLFVEILKWVVVIVVGAMLVQYGQPFGILVGFAATYTAYFWVILKV